MLRVFWIYQGIYLPQITWKGQHTTFMCYYIFLFSMDLDKGINLLICATWRKFGSSLYQLTPIEWSLTKYYKRNRYQKAKERSTFLFCEHYFYTGFHFLAVILNLLFNFLFDYCSISFLTLLISFLIVIIVYTIFSNISMHA